MLFPNVPLTPRGFTTSTGINSQYQIWNAALSAGLGDTSIANAKAATSAQVSALAAAIRTMKKSSALAS